MVKSDSEKPIRPLPALLYCEENVVAILKNFDRAVKMGWIALNIKNTEDKDKAIYFKDEFAPIKRNKTTISQARREPSKLWSTISKTVFENLIEVLYHHQDDEGNTALTVWDNHLHFEKQDDCLSHSLNRFYENKKYDFDLQRLQGVYRTFKTSTVPSNSGEGRPNDIVLGGRLEIEYVPAGNYLKTVEEFRHIYGETDNRYCYKGVINYFKDEGHLIWNDIFHDSLRQTRLRIVSTKGTKYTQIEGYMFLELVGKTYVRPIIIDSTKPKKTDGYIFSDLYTSDKVPDTYRHYFVPGGQNIIRLDSLIHH
jgi:hypothetical protein